MSKTFIVKLRTGSITGPVVANSQVITANIVGAGAIAGADFADGLLTGTITSNAAGAVSFVKQLTGATYAITPTNVTANEGEAVTFTIMTTGVNTGTNLYWKMEGLGPIDYVIGNPGSFQTLSNNTVAFNMVNSVTNMRGGDYAYVVNWLYLRYLGRWPENAGIVDTYVPSLLDGTLSIPQLEANIAGSQEVQNQAALPVGVVQVAANGNAVISGTVINDQRTEPKEFSNLIILTGSLNGTEVARTKFDIENTNNGQLLTFNTPISITEGTNANVTLFSLGGQFINSNVVVTLANVLDSGPNATIGTDVTLNGGISTNVFISTSNAFIYTFNIAAPSDGVSEGEEYFLLRAFTEGGALITSSANIRVVSAT